ncbi:hypothetical protein QBC32DRAFT_245678 [Pseudoneurospora amorphoporcata]|uniref:Uncharacterized protein n=1 Tax=Pseudoneurospora amorphoporcata TaxID=241081 RepID=A0AAN6SCF7_9PEZI|nr:hypothetical protein QBC32DRAFT_245678 [Pseudoneurospora amorphoporcata]
MLNATQAIGSYYSSNGDAMDLDPVDPAFAPTLNNLYRPITPSRPQPPQAQPRIPREVLERVAANIKLVQEALKLPRGDQDAQEAPSTPPSRSIVPGPDNNVQPSPVDGDDLLKRLQQTLDNLPDDILELAPVHLPSLPPDILTVHKLFHFFRATPPKMGCVIPNSERQIWYTPTQQDYVALNSIPKGAPEIVGIYLDKPEYLTSYLTDGCGFVQGWIPFDKTQWCTCRYDVGNKRFVTQSGNETGALVVGYRTPWAPICNGCRGDRSVEVRVLDYLARWFSFSVPPGGYIVDIMGACTQTEELHQAGDGTGPSTPNGPEPEPEGQAAVELTANSQAALRRVDMLIQGDAVKSPTRKSKRRRGDEEVDAAGDMSKRPRVILEKRHRLPDGPLSLHDPFVDGPSAGNPFSEAGGHMMLSDDDEDFGPSAAPPLPYNTPHVGTANNRTITHNNNDPQAPQQPQSVNPPAGGIPPAAVAQVHAHFALKNPGPGGLPPKATAEEVLALWAVQNKTHDESPVALPAGQHCNTCKNPRRPPAQNNQRKCQRCSDLHYEIRQLNFARGWCTNAGCDRHVGFPRPMKAFGEPFAYCQQCRDAKQQKRDTNKKKT